MSMATERDHRGTTPPPEKGALRNRDVSRRARPLPPGPILKLHDPHLHLPSLLAQERGGRLPLGSAPVRRRTNPRQCSLRPSHEDLASIARHASLAQASPPPAGPLRAPPWGRHTLVAPLPEYLHHDGSASITTASRRVTSSFTTIPSRQHLQSTLRGPSLVCVEQRRLPFF